MVIRPSLLTLLVAIALGCSEDEAQPRDVADTDVATPGDTNASDAVADETTTPDAPPVDSGPGCATDDFTKPFDKIPSEFDINTELVTSPIPGSAAPDVVGAFRFICQASHLSYDDPIVYPGQPGKAHLHQFFGNTEANACSTYASLRKKGLSTCMGPLNRSAYWIPAMMNGKGKVVVPDHVAIYYKRFPKDSTFCTSVGKECVPLPRGLRFVFGYNPAKADLGTQGGYFNCQGPTAKPDHYDDLVTAAKNCPTGNQIGAIIPAPSCWNGKDLDSPDHRSHIALKYRDGTTGKEHCPSTHPYIIAGFTLQAWYTVDDDLDKSGTWDASKSTWHFSSDMNVDGSMKMPGTTIHSDWMGAWDDTVMDMWNDNCIDKMLNCSDGVLGNGKKMKRPATFSYKAEPRIVDIPTRP